MAVQPIQDSAEVEDPNALTKQVKPPALPVAAGPAGPTATQPVQPTPSAASPLPISTQQPITPVSATDPLAFSGSAPGSAPGTAPTPISGIGDVGDAPPGSLTSDAAAPTAPGVSAPSAASNTAPAGSGGTGTFGNLSYADAVQAAYKAQQARMAQTGQEEAPIDYSMAGLTDAGLWGMSGADTAANAARAASIQNDPTSTDAAKKLAGLPGYATPNFDRALNNGSDPGLAAHVQQLLGQSAAQGAAGSAPSAPSSSLAPGHANDVGGANLSPFLSALGLPSGAGGARSDRGVSLTPTDPNNPLTAQTITPGPGTDRFKIAQDEFQNFVNASDPAYQASLRDATRHAFGQGRGVSGQLRTSLGDYANNRATQLDAQRGNFLDSALTGSIDDAYRNLGIAQQQQGFQAGQEQNAFNNEATAAQLNEFLTNGAFGRAQGQEQAGYANDPSQTALILSSIFGNQATGAGQAAAGLFGQAGRGSQPSSILDYLKQLGLGDGAPPQPPDTSGQTAGYPGVD